MPKMPPTREDRLAAALRENLKRRKRAARAAAGRALERAADQGPKSARKPR